MREAAEEDQDDQVSSAMRARKTREGTSAPRAAPLRKVGPARGPCGYKRCHGCCHRWQRRGPLGPLGQRHSPKPQWRSSDAVPEGEQAQVSGLAGHSDHHLPSYDRPSRACCAPIIIFITQCPLVGRCNVATFSRSRNEGVQSSALSKPTLSSSEVKAAKRAWIQERVHPLYFVRARGGVIRSTARELQSGFD